MERGQLVRADDRKHRTPGTIDRCLVSYRSGMHGGRRLRTEWTLGRDGPSVEWRGVERPSANADEPDETGKRTARGVVRARIDMCRSRHKRVVGRWAFTVRPRPCA